MEEPDPMAAEELLRRLVIETVRAAAAGAEGPAEPGAAEALGRRVGAALTGEWTAEAAARALGDLGDGAAGAFREGLVAALPSGPEPAAHPAGPPAPWDHAPRIQELPAVTRRAAHDLNQPLTVILGYAAILRRTGDEAIRAEAAEQIVKEARKMGEIIKALSRLARTLDAA
jgi:signal transduction histidine kinase